MQQGAINRIHIGQKHPHECITASSDGSCILWDLTSLKRKCTFSASTFFKDVAWSSDESQLVTAGLQNPQSFLCLSHDTNTVMPVILLLHFFGFLALLADLITCDGCE